jgi:hypothetical protein
MISFNQIEKIRQTDSVYLSEKKKGKDLRIRVVKHQFFMGTQNTARQTKLSTSITSKNINFSIGRPVNGVISASSHTRHSRIDNLG